jgi:DNA-binding NtrC family response regulator
MNYEFKKDDTILFVDDEENVIRSIKRSLIDKPLTVFATTDPFWALEIIKSNNICVLVTDLKMPKLSGLDLIREVDKNYPEIVKIVLTAYYQVPTILSAIQSGQVFSYLTKPWKFEEEFLPTIVKAFKYYHEVKKKTCHYNINLQELDKLENELNKLREENEMLEQSAKRYKTLLKSFNDAFMGYVRLINNIIKKSENRNKVIDFKDIVNLRDSGVMILKNMKNVLEKLEIKEQSDEKH